jgi:hypothetical protein
MHDIASWPPWAKTVRAAAFAAGDAAAARAIVGRETDETARFWLNALIESKEHAGHLELEKLKVEVRDLTAHDARRIAGSLAGSASKISADEGLDATIRTAAAGALAEAARILSAAVPA